jgi:hypothetical protein
MISISGIRSRRSGDFRKSVSLSFCFGDNRTMNTNGIGGRRFERGNTAGLATRFQKGVSGNLLGKSTLQHAFQLALADALAGENPEDQAKELATLVWAAARKGEAWAVQILFQRLAPEPIRLEVSKRGDDEIDFSRLSDEQLNQLEGIFAQLGGSDRLLAGGARAEEPSPIHTTDEA